LIAAPRTGRPVAGSAKAAEKRAGPVAGGEGLTLQWKLMSDAVPVGPAGG
jgi:hypothetical protein